MMSAVIHKQNESCKNMQSHYDEMLAAGGERLESLKMMATAVHEYAGKPLRTDTVCNLLARVRNFSPCLHCVQS